MTGPTHSPPLPGPEDLRKLIQSIQEAQKRLLSTLHTNQIPLSQVAADLARLETELAEAQGKLSKINPVRS